MADSINTYKLLLNPRSGFHLQNGGAHHESSDAFVRSDTLSAAFTHLCFQQYPNSGLDFSKLPFKFSSLMPAILLPSGDVFYLYPRPANQWDVPKKFLSFHKDIKAIKWVSEKVLQKLNQGHDLISLLTPREQLKDVFGKQVYVTEEEFNANRAFFEENNGKGLFANYSRQRVTLDRENSTSMPYTFNVIYFDTAIQLWAYADIESSFLRKAKAILNLLGDEGLGGDRTVGLGQYSLIKMESDNTNQNASDAKKWLNLRVYSPTENCLDTIDWDNSFFEWSTRRGWTLNGSLRRRAMRALNEGAVFPCVEQPEGNVIEALTLEDGNGLVKERIGHSVFRDLRGYFIPL